MPDSLSPIADALEVRDSIPRPNWETIAAWVEAHAPASSLHETWTQIARDWLTRLAEALPHDYAVLESPECLLLVAEDSLGNRVLNWSERARRIILETLEEVASDEGYGKHVVLLFADVDSYYDYIADFYPEEGEFGLSGGIFLPVGYGHFAISPMHASGYERVIAHELNHVLLRHLPLPLWLNEGVTLFMEDFVCDLSFFTVDHEMVQRHRAFWNPSTIDEFWSGHAFHAADEGQELSYHLSQVLFRNLMADYPKAMKPLLNAAHYSDAGNAALLETCKVSLADRVSQFLGDGEWAPRNDYDATEEQGRPTWNWLGSL